MHTIAILSLLMFARGEFFTVDTIFLISLKFLKFSKTEETITYYNLPKLNKRSG